MPFIVPRLNIKQLGIPKYFGRNFRNRNLALATLGQFFAPDFSDFLTFRSIRVIRC